jgi:quercetin dioxygenase-like cupin family protein
MESTIIRAQSEGERLWFYGGGTLTVKATAAETNGSCFIFEDVMVQGKVTPLHLHPDEEEILYVIEGELLVHCDGANRPVGTGGLAVAPRGVAHALLVTSKTARVLTMLAPGKAEAFFRGASEPAQEGPGPVDFGALQASAECNGGIEILGPPPFDMANDLAQAAAGA